ncbi:MAG: transporter [Bacteroidaceae bacterium]|nr:transporter [Bacteroidaceae bacterium]
MTKRTKRNLIASVFAMATLPAMAGGYLTNTNQSIAFLRNPSQDAAIDITSLYNNPAGSAFLTPGFHLSIGLMNVKQSRDVTTTYAPFMLGAANNGEPTLKFKGEASAPILPSLQFAYNTTDNKWAFSFDFGLVGGGGKCQYDNGLPSFESAVAALSMIAGQYGFKNSHGTPNYQYDTFMRGRSYQYGFQFGAAHKFHDNLSVYGGLRLLYVTNNYFGYVKNMRFQYTDDNYYTAREFMAAQHDYYKKITDAGYIDNATANAAHAQIDQLGYTLDDLSENIGLNCNQDAWGLTPVIGVDWKLNEHWNFAAKFEFKTKIRLKNESFNENNEGHGLEKYENGKKVEEDVPAILSVGAMYSPIKQVRINGGFHYFFDKQATKFADENQKLSGGTWEITAGAEWDFMENWTVSAGWQTTRYPNTDAYMRDISFATNSNSFGFGVKWQINKTVAVEAAYFQTLYNTYERTQADYNNLAATAVHSLGYTLPEGVTAPQALAAQGLIPNADYLSGTDKFDRTNRVFGVGVMLGF